MRNNKNISVMLDIIKEKSGLGKTAIMKIIFILQQVYDVDLGYDFEIYTYGPYSSEVMEDIDYISGMGYVVIDTFRYSNSIGYCIDITEKGLDFIKDFNDDEESQQISEVMELFGDKSAKQLELDSTIIYLNNLYIKNGWSVDEDELINNVYEIKPHFSKNAIGEAFDNLVALNII